MFIVDFKPENRAHLFHAPDCKRYATQPTDQNHCDLQKSDTAPRIARKCLAGMLLVALALAATSAYSQSRTQSKKGSATPSRLEAKQIAQRTLPSVILVIIDCEDRRTISYGSGFFVSAGIVATNRHVVECGYKGSVKLIGQDRLYPIVTQWLAPAESLDLALLKVEGLNKPPLTLNSGRNLSIGEKVYAAGNPKGLEGTFSDGIVSSVRADEKLIQHTAPISSGSSGGPLLDEYGKVIGVNTLYFRESQNLNFAVPAVYLKTFLEDVKNQKVLAMTLPRSPDRPAVARRSPPPMADSAPPRTERYEPESRDRSNPPVNTSPPIESRPPAPEKPPIKDRIFQAKADIITKNYSKAESVLLGILNENPNHPEANYLLGKLYLEMKRYSRSLPYLAKAIDTIEDQRERDEAKKVLGAGYVLLGEMSLRIKQYEEGVSYLEKGFILGAPVTLPIAHHRRAGPNNDLNDGEIVLQKDSIEFHRSSNKTRSGRPINDESFNAPLSSIYELKYDKASAEKLKIVVGIQRPGNKEDRRTYNFYPIEAKVRATGTQGFSLSGTEIECFQCGPGTEIIYKFLSNIKK
jgi:hypothetical protein